MSSIVFRDTILSNDFFFRLVFLSQPECVVLSDPVSTVSAEVHFFEFYHVDGSYF